MAFALPSLTSFQKLMWFGYSLAGLLNAAAWLVLVLYLPHQAPITILHYNIFFGPDSFGSWYQALVLPVVGLVFLLLDAYGSWYVWKKDRFLSYALTSGAVAVQVVVVVAAGLLIRINGTL